MTGYSASPLYLQHLDPYSRKKQFFILSSLSHPLPAFLSAPPSLASPAEWQTCLSRQDTLATVARWIHTVLFTHSETVAALMPQSSGFSRPFPLYNAALAAVVSTSLNGEFTLSSGADASRLNIFRFPYCIIPASRCPIPILDSGLSDSPPNRHDRDFTLCLATISINRRSVESRNARDFHHFLSLILGLLNSLKPIITSV